MTEPVFVVTLEGTEPPSATPLTVLAFTCAQDAAAAEQAAIDELERLGWSGVRALRSGEVTEPAALPDDFAGAYANALRYGCALIIYEEP